MRCQGRNVTLRRTLYHYTRRFCLRKKPTQRKIDLGGDATENGALTTLSEHLDQTMTEASAFPRLFNYMND